MASVLSSESKTCARTVSIKHEWKIEGFDKLMSLFKTGQSLESSEFGAPKVCRVLWKLEIFPNGQEKEEDNGLVCIFLTRQDDCGPNTQSIMTNYTIYAVDFKGDEVESIGDGKTVEEFNFMDGFGGKLSHKTMKKACLSDGSLHLICELDFIPPRATFSVEGRNPPNLEVNMSKKLAETLQSGMFSDCKFRVGDRTLDSHRLILGMHSQVFRNMFETKGMTEAENGVIDIPDSTFEPVHAMLIWMYTGKVKEVNKYPGDVLGLAEKYCILELKNVCERRLCEALSNNIICDILTVADTFNAPILKHNCMQFMTNHHKEVLQSDDWARFTKDHPSFAFQVMHDVLMGATVSDPPPMKKTKLG